MWKGAARGGSAKGVLSRWRKGYAGRAVLRIGMGAWHAPFYARGRLPPTRHAPFCVARSILHAKARARTRAKERALVLAP
eukprot:4842756-Prymnesium_polylepis.1